MLASPLMAASAPDITPTHSQIRSYDHYRISVCKIITFHSYSASVSLRILSTISHQVKVDLKASFQPGACI